MITGDSQTWILPYSKMKKFQDWCYPKKKRKENIPSLNPGNCLYLSLPFCMFVPLSPFFPSCASHMPFACYKGGFNSCEVPFLWCFMKHLKQTVTKPPVHKSYQNYSGSNCIPVQETSHVILQLVGYSNIRIMVTLFGSNLSAVVYRPTQVFSA